jgi:uncharacterized membrane protein
MQDCNSGMGPMANTNDTRLHRLLKASLLLKGAHALIECASGIALSLVSTQTILNVVRLLTQQELTEDPQDRIAHALLTAAEGFSVSSQPFYVFYLLSHGLVKLVLVIALLRDRLWAYPASLLTLSLFILYQLYRYSFTHSLPLLLLTGFDLVVIALIWKDYSAISRQRHRT